MKTGKNGILQQAAALCLTFAMAVGFVGVPATVTAAVPRRPVLTRPFNPPQAWLIVDAQTGETLYADNADAKRHPASLTKIMTLILAFDALENGKLELDQEIRTPKAATVLEGHSSKLSLRPGDKIKVVEAVNALIVKSANDVAVTLAVAIARAHGDKPKEASFAKLMNDKAQEIGMKDTRFVNASGLHDPNQVTTARDMAKLAQYLIEKHPTFYAYFSQLEFQYSGKQHKTHNHLMESYKGMDGIKTGFLSTSGFNLVASAVHDGHRLIGVVFGGKSASERDQHMAYLLDSAF
ncbi:MAG TPA: D-alanyl-D-alanine carboxypeptidase family protein, partial [Micavibrio sp.]